MLRCGPISSVAHGYFSVRIRSKPSNKNLWVQRLGCWKGRCLARFSHAIYTKVRLGNDILLSSSNYYLTALRQRQHVGETSPSGSKVLSWRGRSIWELINGATVWRYCLSRKRHAHALIIIRHMLNMPACLLHTIRCTCHICMDMCTSTRAICLYTALNLSTASINLQQH